MLSSYIFISKYEFDITRIWVLSFVHFGLVLKGRLLSFTLVSFFLRN